MNALVWAVVASLAVGVDVASAVDIVSCGQVVAAGEIGELSGPLDCSAAPAGSVAVGLRNRAVLQLHGNTITAAPAGVAVSCSPARTCKIEGPGWLLAAPFPATPGTGVSAEKNVVISGDGLEVYRHQTGISAADGTAKLEDVHLRDNGDGVVAKVVKAERTFVIHSDRVGIIASKSVRGQTIEIRDSGWAGIETRSFRIDGLIASQNGSLGAPSGGALVATRRGVLRNSLLDANQFDGVALDLLTGRRPALVDTSCGVSAMLVDGAPSGTWGICSQD